MAKINDCLEQTSSEVLYSKHTRCEKLWSSRQFTANLNFAVFASVNGIQRTNPRCNKAS